MIKIGTIGGTGQTAYLNRSDWSGQLVQNAKQTSPLDSSHRVYQNSYKERPIWSSDERVMIKFTQTGLVRPVGQDGQNGFDSPVQVGICILTWNLYKI